MREELEATQVAFRSQYDSNEHFVTVGRVLGLIRLRELHDGVITDLQAKIKDQDEQAIHATES